MQTLFKSIERGSVILPLYPQYQIPCLIEDEISPYLTINGALDRLMFTYSAHPENLNNQLETEIEDPVARLGVLKSIQKISNIDTTIEIKTSASQPKSGHRFPQTKDKNITALINKFKENGSQTIQGIIFGFSGEPGNYYFIIRTKNGKSVKCFYKSEEEKLIKSLYKKWISVTGDVKISTQSYKIENITTIKEQLTEEIQTVGNYELKNPITFTTSYDEKEEIWGMVNEELAIYGYGNSYIATLQSLEGEIEAHIINFSEYPEEKHAKDSLLLKKKLSEYFDFKKLHKQMKEKYGEG